MSSARRPSRLYSLFVDRPVLTLKATVALLLQSSAQRWLGRRDVPGAARGPGMMR